MHVLDRLKERYNIRLTTDELLAKQKAISIGEPILPFFQVDSKKYGRRKTAIVDINGTPVPCGCIVMRGHLTLATALPKTSDESFAEAFEEIYRHGSIKEARHARLDWLKRRRLSNLLKRVRRLVERDPSEIPSTVEAIKRMMDHDLLEIDPGIEPLAIAACSIALAGERNSLGFIHDEIKAHIDSSIRSNPLSWDLYELTGRYAA